MHVDGLLDASAPALTQARVTVTFRDGRSVSRAANGARGYPAQPASAEELGQKFMNCATRAISKDAAERALERLRGIENLPSVQELTSTLLASTIYER
jgi:hypothetical protein